MIKQLFALLVVSIGLNTALAGTYEDGAKAQFNGDYRTALQYYQQAIEESDDPRAINALGTMHERGEGVKQDYKKAVDYYFEAAQKGNAKAFGNVAAMYDRGLGVKKNQSFAFSTYIKGMNHGDGKSINNIGVMIGKGELFDFNIVVAWAMFAYATDKGDIEAPNNLKTTQSVMTAAEIKEGKKALAILRKSQDPVLSMYKLLGLDTGGQ